MAPDTPREERRRRLSGKCEERKKRDVGLPTPPDGGWGWIVVFGSFMIHVIADGVAYSFGIFYIEFLDYFQAGRGPTGWIGSLMVGITWGSGPIASALTNKYGCRAVTIAGSIVSSCGFILSIFAPNIWYMYFSFGMVGGFGLGLIYLPAIVSVTYYFEKRRAFATGLAVCGSGLGTFIFAPLTKILVQNYGWKGAVLIEAGLLLNCVACGALFRPLEAPSMEEELESPVSNGKIYTGNGHPLSNGNIPSVCIHSDTDEEPETPTTTGGPINAPLLRIMNGGIASSAHSLQITSSDTLDNKQGDLRRHGSDTELHKQQGRKRTTTVTSIKSDEGNLRVRVLARKDIFYTSSLYNIPMYRSNPNMYNQSILSLPDITDGTDEESCKISSCLPSWLRCSPELKDSFRQMMDFSLLKNPLFLMFAISNLFTSIGFCVPYTFLPDRATLLGISDNRAAFLIAVIGIANTLGRVIFGWLSDRPCINRLWLYNSALTLCGVCTALSAFCRTYEWLIAYAASFGMFIGVYVSLTSVVLVDLLGLDVLTSSFGLTLMFQGVAAILGPPTAGWITDYYGSYDIAFFIMGTIIAVSGLMLFFIPCVRSHVEKKQEITQHDVDMGRKVTDERIVSQTDLYKTVPSPSSSNFV